MNCDYCGKENSSLMTIELEGVVKYNCCPCTKLYFGKYGGDISNVTGYYYNCKLIREEDGTIPSPIISRGETPTDFKLLVSHIPMNLSKINKLIAELSEEERNSVSDGYHTFGELYEHRCVLFIALVNLSNYVTSISPFKKSKTHADGTSRDGYFIVQGYIKYQQISYHLPMKYRDNVRCETVVIADKRDGHNSQDVLDRLLLV